MSANQVCSQHSLMEHGSLLAASPRISSRIRWEVLSCGSSFFRASSSSGKKTGASPSHFLVFFFSQNLAFGTCFTSIGNISWIRVGHWRFSRGSVLPLSQTHSRDHGRNTQPSFFRLRSRFL